MVQRTKIFLADTVPSSIQKGAEHRNISIFVPGFKHSYLLIKI